MAPVVFEFKKNALSMSVTLHTRLINMEQSIDDADDGDSAAEPLSPHSRGRLAIDGAIATLRANNPGASCSHGVPLKPKFTDIDEARSTFTHAILCEGAEAPCGLPTCTPKVAAFKEYIRKVRTHTEHCLSENHPTCELICPICHERQRLEEQITRVRLAKRRTDKGRTPGTVVQPTVAAEAPLRKRRRVGEGSAAASSTAAAAAAESAAVEVPASSTAVAADSEMGADLDDYDIKVGMAIEIRRSEIGLDGSGVAVGEVVAVRDDVCDAKLVQVPPPPRAAAPPIGASKSKSTRGSTHAAAASSCACASSLSVTSSCDSAGRAPKLGEDSCINSGIVTGVRPSERRIVCSTCHEATLKMALPTLRCAGDERLIREGGTCLHRLPRLMIWLMIWLMLPMLTHPDGYHPHSSR